MRILTLAALVSMLISAVPFAAHRATVRPASACQYGPEVIDSYFRESDVIALVDVLAVGDAVNHAPTLTATATLPPPSTPTPEGTPTSTGGLHIRLTPEATSTPQPPPGPSRVIDGDLSGIGADLSVVKIYVGEAPPRFAADAEIRASIERKIRELEAGLGYFSTCPVAGFTPRYQQGARYVGLFSKSATGELATDRLFVVDDSDIVNEFGLGMSYSLYRGYFTALETAYVDLPRPELPDGYATVAEPRFPIAILLRAIQGVRGSSYHITPPNTGSAGLLPNGGVR